VHGAGWLSRQAISTLALAIEDSQTKDIDYFIGETKLVAEELIKARPSMVSIANYVNQFLHELWERANKKEELKSLVAWARVKSDELIKLSEQATDRAIEYGSGIISVADTVITCSYSSTVCKSLELAKDNEEKFRVLVAESAVNGKVYGEITARELMQHGVPTEVIPDALVPQLIAKADKALVGADSILADGSLINGIPSLTVAQAAKKVNIPFFTVCETAKFDVRSHMSEALEPEAGVEKIPANLITGIITEKGIMAPSMIIAYVSKIAHSLP